MVEGDPDGADGEAVIEEGAVGSQVVMTVVVSEAGQVQSHSKFGQEVGAAVVAMVLGMTVRMCHESRLADWSRSVACLS